MTTPTPEASENRLSQSTPEPAPPAQPPHEQPEPPADDEQDARAREAEVDAALKMTFPASDPPSWTP